MSPRVPCQRSALIVLALDSSFGVYSFTGHSEILPQRHRDVLENVPALVKWLPLCYTKTAVAANHIYKEFTCWAVPSRDGGNVRKRD